MNITDQKLTNRKKTRWRISLAIPSRLLKSIKARHHQTLQKGQLKHLLTYSDAILNDIDMRRADIETALNAPTGQDLFIRLADWQHQHRTSM